MSNENKKPVLDDFANASDYMVALHNWEKEQAKKPLYKVLNERRSKEIFEQLGRPNQIYPYETKLTIKGDSLHLVGILYGDNTTQSEANAQYTALAVNNLHHLAEALEGMMGAYDSLLISFKKTQRLEIIHPSYDKAKEALAHIS